MTISSSEEQFFFFFTLMLCGNVTDVTTEYANLPEIPDRVSLDKILSVWGRLSPSSCFFPALYLKSYKHETRQIRTAKNPNADESCLLTLRSSGNCVRALLPAYGWILLAIVGVTFRFQSGRGKWQATINYITDLWPLGNVILQIPVE